MPCPTILPRLCILFPWLSASFYVTSLMTGKRSETGTFHSFTNVYSGSGCFEVSIKMVYCVAFGCKANSSKNKITCTSFQCPMQMLRIELLFTNNNNSFILHEPSPHSSYVTNVTLYYKLYVYLLRSYIYPVPAILVTIYIYSHDAPEPEAIQRTDVLVAAHVADFVQTLKATGVAKLLLRKWSSLATTLKMIPWYHLLQPV